MRNLFVSTIFVLALPAPLVLAANEAPGAGEIDALFAEIDAAFSAGDAEGVLNRFSDHYLSDAPPMTKGQLRESLKSLCGAGAPVKSHHELRNRLVYGNRAIVEARHELTAGDEVEVSNVHYRLSAASGAWRIVTRTVLPQGVEAPKPGQPFEIKSFGVRVDTPKKWHIFLGKMPPVAGDDSAALRMESPDLGASVSVCVFSMPVPIAPKELAALCQRQISTLVPDSKFDQPKVTQQDGQCEIRLDWNQPCSDFAEESRIVIRQANSRLIVAELSIHEKDNASEYEPVFETMLASMSLGEPEVLPPDQGHVDGTIYANDIYGCRVEFPTGWSLKQIRAFGFCTVGESPDGKSSITFAGWRLPDAFGAAELIDADEAMTAELDETFKHLERSAARLGAHEWETSVSLTAAGGEARKRWRLYTVHDDVLFFFVCDAIPPEKFDAQRDTFERTVKTLVLQSPAADAPVIDQSMLANPKDRRGSRD